MVHFTVQPVFPVSKCLSSVLKFDKLCIFADTWLASGTSYQTNGVFSKKSCNSCKRGWFLSNSFDRCGKGGTSVCWLYGCVPFCLEQDNYMNCQV